MDESVKGATDATAFKHAYETLHSGSDLQFSLPDYQPPQPPRWLEDLLHFIQHYFGAIKWIAIALASVIVAALLFRLARYYWRVFKAREPARDDAEPVVSDIRWRPTPEAARQLLSESDALAAQGRFAEAVHLLLLRSIDDIEERRPRAVRPALTSREISLLNALPGRPRAAFNIIVRMVERARFAGLSIAKPDFEICRREYESFAFAPDWKAGARID